MLSDHERRTLNEIEQGLLIEDPHYSKSFDTETELLPAPGVPELMSRVYRVLTLLSLIFAILFLAVGSPLSALSCLAVTTLTWVARHYHQTRKRAGR
jgi:hypothetical protein